MRVKLKLPNFLQGSRCEAKVKREDWKEAAT